MLGALDIKGILLGMGFDESSILTTYVEREEVNYFTVDILIEDGGIDYKFRFHTSLDRTEDRLDEEERETLYLLGESVLELWSVICEFIIDGGKTITAAPYKIESEQDMISWIQEVLSQKGKFWTGGVNNGQWGVFMRFDSPSIGGYNKRGIKMW